MPTAPDKKPAAKKAPVRKAAKKPSVVLAAEEKKPARRAPAEALAMPTGDFLKKIGRRKEASAQVKLFPGGKGTITVNGRDYRDYFPRYDLREALLGSLKLSGREATVDVAALVRGGGLKGQADAIRLGIARALIELDLGIRTTLKKSGFLTRDARVKERKKYGLKKARKAPQWAKR